jgi:hypothetical protein
MRFFGRGFDTQEDDEAARILRAYRAHFRSIAERLPAPCTVIDALSLHDGVVTALRAEADWTLSCVAGDLQRGYYALDLRYVPAPGTRMPVPPGLIGDDIVRDEFDLTGGHFVHRLRFARGTEIEIGFADLVVRCERVADRDGSPIES